MVILAGAFVAGVYLTIDFTLSENEVEGEFRRPDNPVRVELAPVTRQALEETFTYPGTVHPSEMVSITPKVAGTITAVHVEMGDYVDAGDLLVELDDSEFVKRLNQAEANLRLAEAQMRRTTTQYELAQREYDRATQSGRQGIASQRDLDEAEAARDTARAELDVAQAEVERMRAALEEAELNVENTRIHAPISAWVQTREVDAGEIASSTTTILSLVDTDPAEVSVYVPERQVGIARIGQEATVSLSASGPHFPGAVARIAPSLRTSSRTSELVIAVPNPDTRLRPGMSADVTLVARADEAALVVPEEALIFRDGEPAVYRVENWKARFIPVEPGIREGGLVQILRGLDEGDRVVINGQFLLDDGDEVSDGTRPTESRDRRADS